MTIEEQRLLLEPFITFFSALLASGVGSSVAVQVLKLNWFPFKVDKYPRVTNIVVSILSTFVAIYVSGLNFTFNNAFDYSIFAVGTLVVSALTYKVLLNGTTSKDGNSVETIK